IEHAGKNDETAEATAGRPGRPLSQIGRGNRRGFTHQFSLGQKVSLGRNRLIAGILNPAQGPMQNGGRRAKITLGIPMLFSLPSFFRYLLLLGVMTCFSFPVLAQENETAPLVSPPPPQPSATVSPLSSAGVLAAASPSPSAATTPMVLNDLLFKNVKAR